MKQILHLPAEANRYARFQLPASSGELIVIEPGLVEIFALNRSDDTSIKLATSEPIDISKIHFDELYVRSTSAAGGVSNSKFQVTENGETKELLVVTIIATVLVDCDADRDGKVGVNEEGKANWTWGPNGRGAIVLVDNDRDPISVGSGALDEREPIIIRDTGVSALPQGVELRLSTAPAGAMKFSIFRKNGTVAQKLLGRGPNEPIQDLVSSAVVNLSGETLHIAAHEYPGPFFEGLIIISLELVHIEGGSERVLASDRIMLRVAPWIMTPNTQEAEQIYTCEITRGITNNKDFLAGLKAAVSKEGLPLEVIPESVHRGDRWIQDEIEIGYTRNHRGQLPVVFDSPRDRGLDAYPEISLLGKDFGHFVVGGGIPNSLDSFGNLEVSPPVVVDGRVYPLGRIIVGGRRDGDFTHSSRQMMAEIRQFLYAQKVQFPFEVFTDWLSVAHVDEIVSFVPSEKAPGFKVLLASTKLVKSILDDLSSNGHGGVKLFAGKTRIDGSTAEITVDSLRTNGEFWKGNGIYQAYLDETRAVLKRELGVSDSDIIDVPVSFQVRFLDSGELTRTLAFFPDMVNHLVHKDLSIVPKPYGPIISGKCAFEKAFEDALPERRIVFIDDWHSYHEVSGEVHCGTNARRKPFGVSRWWNVRPEGGFDIKSNELVE